MSQPTNDMFTLDASAIEAFSDILNNEGHMRAGFVIHESNNNTHVIEQEDTNKK